VASIEVDFQVYKRLTMLREREHDTYNDVIRDLLKLPRVRAPDPAANGGGALIKGVLFPEGTEFRVNYKGRMYTAKIAGGRWIGEDGAPRNSPSDAAHAITGNNVNGWRFWECKRPSDSKWRVMDQLR
jgi:hypothetical protein